MDCKAAHARLIPFHFGALQPDVRTLLEAHLQGCAACLRAHLAVKRAIDEGMRARGPAALGLWGAAGGLRGAALGGLVGAALALLLSAGVAQLRRPAPTLAVPEAPSPPAPRAGCAAPPPADATFI